MVTVRATENFVSRFLSIFSGRMLTKIVALLSTPIVVRLLGPAGFGDYALLLSVFSMYMIPISGSVTEGVQKFVSENRDRPHWREHVVQFYLLLGLGVVSLGAVALAGFTAVGGAAMLFGEAFTGYFYLLAVYVVVSQFRAVTYHTVLGFGLEPISESLNLVKKVVTVLLGIGLIVVGYGVAGMVVGHIAANLVIALAAGVVVARRLSLDALFQRPSSFPYRELLSFNGLNVVLVLLVMSLFHVDIIMLGTLADSASTGFYKAALAVAEFLWLAPMVLQVMLLHSSSRLWSEARHEDITALAARITRYTVLLVTLLAIGLATLAGRFVPLYYGAAFEAAVTPLLLLIPGVVGFAAARPLLAISQGSGEIKTLIVGIFGAAAANFVLNALLIPSYGMAGAAVATSTSYGSMFIFLVLTARRIGYRPLDDFRGARIAATVAIAAPVIVLAERAIGGDVLALLVVPPLGAAVYAAAALATGAVDAEETRDILERLPEPVGSAIESGRSLAGRLLG